MTILGNTWRSSCVFTDATDTVADPTTVTATVYERGNVLATYTYGAGLSVVRASVGSYYLDVTPHVAGAWSVLWSGVSAGYSTADEASWTVDAP